MLHSLSVTSPLRVDCTSNQSLNSIADSGHGSSPDSTDRGGVLENHTQSINSHTKKEADLPQHFYINVYIPKNRSNVTCLKSSSSHEIESKLPKSSGTDREQYPKTQNELNMKLEVSNRFEPANIPMIVARSHTPIMHCDIHNSVMGIPESCEQVSVTKGMLVNALYKISDWIYVRTPLDESGFVPAFCLQPIGIKKKVSDFCQQFPEKSNRKSNKRFSQTSSTYEKIAIPIRFKWEESIARKTKIYELTKLTYESPPSHEVSTLTLPENEVTVNRSHEDYIDMSQTQDFCQDDYVDMTSSCQADMDIAGCHHGKAGDYEEHPFTKAIRAASRSVLMDYFIKTRDLKQQINSAFMLKKPKEKKSTIGGAKRELALTSSSSNHTETEKKPNLTVLFDYLAQDANDVTVRNHDVVTLLNDADRDWIWVRTEHGKKGFIPRTYAVNLEVFNLDPRAKTTYL